METSFESSSKWYDSAVGSMGHYYHQNVIIPHLLTILNLQTNDSVLDLACGQGVFSRHIPKGIEYVGVDLSNSLVKNAMEYRKEKKHLFIHADVCQKLPIEKKDFKNALIMLALQNIERGDLVIKNARAHLDKKGTFAIVLNHPCFRIPRQSAWQVDEAAKMQYRRINTYLSSQKIPIMTQPGKKDSEVTYSFHNPISTISKWIFDGGFYIERIEEWCSDKKSSGEKAKMENRARKEFPLFLTFIAKCR